VADRILQEASVQRTKHRGYEGIDFIGPYCRRILTKAWVITNCEAFRHLEASDDVNNNNKAKALRLLQFTMTSFETAYVNIVSSRLHPETLQNIVNFGAAHDAFVKLYRTLPDTKLQPARNHNLHSPQIHTFLIEVPLWITKNKCTLARESEQAGEAQHKRVTKTLARFMIPPTRAIPGKHQSTSAPSSSSSSSSPAPAAAPPSPSFATLGVSSSSTLAAARAKVMRAFIS